MVKNYLDSSPTEFSNFSWRELRLGDIGTFGSRRFLGSLIPGHKKSVWKVPFTKYAKGSLLTLPPQSKASTCSDFHNEGSLWRGISPVIMKRKRRSQRKRKKRKRKRRRRKRRRRRKAEDVQYWRKEGERKSPQQAAGFNSLVSTD